MGYTTDFEGSFALNKPLTKEHAAYLQEFANTRRMKRDPEKAKKLPDPCRESVGLPIGIEGGYFVGGDTTLDGSILDHNHPPKGQPSLWCQWVPSRNREGLEWDGNEKFYEYVEWLGYLIENFFKPWGYVLNGEVSWQGEDSGDLGKIVVKDNEVTTLVGRIVYE